MANPLPKGRKGRTPNQKRWSEPPLQESEGKPPPKKESGGERRSELPSYGQVEGIHFNFLSFHSKKGERPGHTKEGRGREHQPPTTLVFSQN